MKLNWRMLSASQAELDLHIGLEKQLLHADFLKEKAIALCVELGELLNEREEIFKYWKTYRKPVRQKALIEYVDVLHFLLSYGNAIKFDFSNYEYKQPKEIDKRDLILGLFAMFGSLQYTNQFEDALNHYLFLAEKLNFTSEEIKQRYILKNSENHRRQEVGY